MEKNKKHYLILLLLSITMLMVSCGNTKKIDDSGDGWYISDGTLCVSKIYYTVLEIAGSNRCVYEQPWVEYKNKNLIKSIIIDADMVYTKESYITGEEYPDLATEGEPFLGDGPLFGNMDSLESISIKKLNFDRITDISYMFGGNRNLTHVDASGLNLSGVADASYLFYGDSALENIDLQNLNTSSLVTIEGMFRDCTKLKSVSLSSWNTGNIRDFSHLFSGCISLPSIDINGWTIENADVIGMFYDCDALNSVQLSMVKLKNVIASSSMFDENNSISSYYFAEDWDICVEKHKQIWPISDDCYSSRIISDLATGITVECIYYKKFMPAWYEESVEYRQAIDDWTKLYDSAGFDIYVNRIEGEFSASDVVEVALDCLKASEKINDDEAILVNNVVNKLEILVDWEQGDYSIESIVGLLEMTEEELKILKEE